MKETDARRSDHFPGTFWIVSPTLLENLY